MAMEIPKKSPLLQTLLLVAILCGFYIFSICIRQTSLFRQTRVLRIQSFRNPSCGNTSPPDVHFPMPSTFDREECGCNPVRYFAIVSMQRSGSGWFETLLNSHRNVSSNGEIFGAQRRRMNASVIYNTLDRVYNLDWFSSASKNECSAAVGFKWMLNQGLLEYHEEICDYFKSRSVSIIFLLRKNLLRRLISLVANQYDKEFKLLNGTHKSHVHTPHEAEVLASYKPKINITRLVSDLRGAERNVKRALERFKCTRHMLLYYEDVVANRTKLREVQEFLKLPERNLTSLQVKIHRGVLSNQISNFDQVEKRLNGTSYAHYLHTQDYIF